MLKSVFHEISKILPEWFFKFNNGTIYFTTCPSLKVRDNSKFTFHLLANKDLEELSQFCGISTERLNNRLKIGDIGMITRDTNSKMIVTIQWSHQKSTYIRGYNYTLNIPDNAAYLYWAFSAPEVRLTGIFNSAFREMVELLNDKNINEYYGLVEFWNKGAHKYHQRINFIKIIEVTYFKFLFLKIVFEKNHQLNILRFRFNIFEPSNIDII